MAYPSRVSFHVGARGFYWPSGIEVPAGAVNGLQFMCPIIGEGLSRGESKSGRVVAVYYIRPYWSLQCWGPLLPATIGHNNPAAAPLLAPRLPAQQPIQHDCFDRYFEAKYL